jgi:hypothetical protein
MIDVADIQPRGAMPKSKFEPLAKGIFTLKKQINKTQWWPNQWPGEWKNSGPKVNCQAM